MVAAAGLTLLAANPAFAPPPDIELQLEPLRSGTDPPDHEALIEQARLAFERGNVQTADTMFRRVLFREPDNESAYQGLVALWDSRPLPIESEPLDAVRELLPSFTELTTRHFVICSNSPSRIVQQYATRLERTHHEFHRYARRMELKPLPLRHRLVCVLFEDHDTYATFARTHDNIAADWIAGYYTPRHDRAVFYNAHSNPGVFRARSDLAGLEQHVEQARADASEESRNGDGTRARRMHSAIEKYRRHLHEQRRDIDAFAEQFSTATTVHETVHQLLFHTHVQSPYVEYPLWISEGLATSFETDSVSVAFGPEFTFDLRQHTFEDILRGDRLYSLSTLVTLTRPPDSDRDGVDVMYHQSYALVTWLHRHRRTALVDYLRYMRNQPPGRLTEQQHLNAFEHSFGTVDRLERDWLRDERSRID